jgi:hypothetical protein
MSKEDTTGKPKTKARKQTPWPSTDDHQRKNELGAGWLKSNSHTWPTGLGQAQKDETAAPTQRNNSRSRKPAATQSRPSLLISSTKGCGCRACALNTRALLSFHSDQATSRTKVSNPLRSILTIRFLHSSHQSTSLPSVRPDSGSCRIRWIFVVFGVTSADA